MTQPRLTPYMSFSKFRLNFRGFSTNVHSAFWQNFDSWREFSHNSEHDVDSAEHRDEKRWMMKKNEAVAKKKKKKEYARLSNLVDRSMAVDPRIRREKFQKKETKRLAKLRKEEAKAAEAAAEAAAEQAKLEEEEKRKAEAKAAKYEREMAKKALRKAKKHFRALLTACRDMGLDDVPDVVETEDICDASDFATIKGLSDGLGGIDNIQVDGLEAVRHKLASLK